MNDIFTDEQIDRPLFEEPTLRVERADPADGPFGFMVGGTANLSPPYLAQQYSDAADLLCQNISLGHWYDYGLANPILFLYRHAIELLLKSVVRDAGKTHGLAELADQFRRDIEREFDADVPSWITRRITEIAAIDPASTAFRYNRNFDRSSKRDIPVKGEFHVDLRHLQKSIEKLSNALIEIFAAIECGEGKSSPGADRLAQ